MNCARCGHLEEDHEKTTGPCNVRKVDRNFVCYQFTRTDYTPGPWEVCSGMVQTVAEHKCKIPGCGVHIPIAYMDREPGNGTLPVERDANARLIAAAPELLEAAKRALGILRQIQLIDEGPGAIPWVEADFLDLAIQKAEGK